MENVARTSREREIITRIKGQESVEIEVYKEADANIVSVAERVKSRIYGTSEQRAFVEQLKKRQKEAAEKEKESGKKEAAVVQDFDTKQKTNFIAYDLPEGSFIETLSDQSIFIKNSVDEVINTAVIGGVLAILILFVFLRLVGPTLIIGLAIPISIISTFAPMKIFDVSLNIMSLGGLALGIGMLVDNSIVVLESIARCREEGDDLIRATIRGVSEVGGAVIASTLTTIAVFFPIIFVEGVAGQIFGDMALTVVFSLLASLAVALFLIPMLSSRQTQTFIKGAETERIPKKYILNYELNEKVDLLFKGKSGGTRLKKLYLWLNYIFISLITSVFKLLKVLLAFILAFIKQLLLILLVIVQIPAGIVKLFWRKGRYGDHIQKFAQNQHPKLDFVNEIWTNFLSFNSVDTLYLDFGKIKSSYRGLSYRPGCLVITFNFSKIQIKVIY